MLCLSSMSSAHGNADKLCGEIEDPNHFISSMKLAKALTLDILSWIGLDWHYK